MRVGITSDFTPNDHALLAEAVRRVQGARFRSQADKAAVAKAVTTAMLDGRRDLFGLVKAGCNAA